MLEASTRRRRKPKPPLAAWIVAQREAQPSDDGTGRSVLADNVRAMERLFGVEAPDHEATGEADLAAAIRDQTAAINALVERLDLFVGPLGEVVADLLREKVTAATDRTRSGAASS